MPAEAIPGLDFTTIATLAGTAIGTAIAVVWGYRSSMKKPVATLTTDVVLPTAAIANMAPISEPLKQIAAHLGSIHDSMRDWREEDLERRDRADIARESYEAGLRHAKQAVRRTRRDKPALG